jgi:hypothetical protein
MNASLKLLALAGLMAAAPAFSQPARTPIYNLDEEPVAATFTPGGQYTATLDQTHNQWRLQPANGQDVVIDAGNCATGAMVPTGFWLLVLDDDGRPALVAPSITQLPKGAPERVALRTCDRASGNELAVPQTVLDLLTVNTGAIYVID